jgi:hypothetical protein
MRHYRLSGVAVAALCWVACGPRPMPPGYAGDDARAFVQKHRSELQAEIAAGSGPRLYDLAILANCQDVPQLGRRLHRRQEELFYQGAREPADGRPASAAPGEARGVSGAAVSDSEAADRVVRFMQERRELRCLNLDISRQREFAAGRRYIGPRRGATTARGGTP